MQTRSKFGITKPKNFLSLLSLYTETKPSSFKEASQNSYWKDAIDDEIQSMITSETWELVPYDPAQNLVTG